jgi:NADH-quinone oxidoreductase subunit M
MALLAMPGSANFIGEIYILFGAFESKIAIGIVAFAGVAMAAYYALRLFQRSMHNRKRDDVTSTEIGRREGAIVGALVACVIALAVYPGFVLQRADDSVGAQLSSVDESRDREVARR